MKAELTWFLENQMEMNQMFSHAPYSKRYDWVTHAGPSTLCKEFTFFADVLLSNPVLDFRQIYRNSGVVKNPEATE